MRAELQQFLAATDLDELGGAFDELREAGDLPPDDDRAVLDVVTSWTDQQALANLLMYPPLIAAPSRLTAVERALADAERTYVRLAAVVGIDRLDPVDLPDDARHRLVQTLLDLIAGDAGVTAERASITIIGLLRTTDAPDVVEVLGHPSLPVRQNLTQALIHLTGMSGVAALLDEPGFVEAETRRRVREQLISDGVDVSSPSEEQRRPFILSYLPNYAEWQG